MSEEKELLDKNNEEPTNDDNGQSSSQKNVPYDRFKEVNAERKVYLEELEKERKLREEAENRLSKIDKQDPAPKRDGDDSRIGELVITVESRELLDTYPEAKQVLESVKRIARMTNKSVKDVYKDNFLEVMSAVSKPSGDTLRPANRHADEDAEPNPDKEIEKLTEQFHKATGKEKTRLSHEILKRRLFKKK